MTKLQEKSDRSRKRSVIKDLDRPGSDTQLSPVHDDGVGADQSEPVPQEWSVRADSIEDLGHQDHDSHGDLAQDDGANADQDTRDTQKSAARVGSVAEFTLGMAAATLSDVEGTRIALGNRLAAMEREGINMTREYDTLAAMHTGILAIEHEATKSLQRAMRAHPLGLWVKRTIGVGEKQGARLIAAIGDVYWNHLDDRPRRGPAELWAYCGYKPGQRRQRGVQSNWDAEAKMRARLIAESCIKHASSPYRSVYDLARARWDELHPDASLGHKHNHALRCVAKMILRDLWVEARAQATAENVES